LFSHAHHLLHSRRRAALGYRDDTGFFPCAAAAHHQFNPLPCGIAHTGLDAGLPRHSARVAEAVMAYSFDPASKAKLDVPHPGLKVHYATQMQTAWCRQKAKVLSLTQDKAQVTCHACFKKL
jgi:hypothetical protein